MSELLHYGTPRHSGRYPWGSGENPYQHDGVGFYSEYKRLKSEGKSEKEICELMGVKSTYLRTRVSAAKEAEMLERNAKIIKMKEKGYYTISGKVNRKYFRSRIDYNEGREQDASIQG